MTDIFDGLAPALLTAYARTTLAAEDRPENQLILERWFPSVTSNRIRFEWAKGTTRDYTAAAPFRAFGTPGVTGVRPGRAKRRGKMAPTTMWYALSEDDILAIREAIDQGGQVGEAVQDDVFGDIDAGIRAIRNRMEIVRADALINGSASISEHGLNFTVDFLRDPDNEDTTAVAWTTPATATPFQDERSALAQMRLKGFGPSDLVSVMSDATWQSWLATDQVREAIPTVRVMETVTENQGLILRREHRLPDVLVYDATVHTVTDSARQLIPDGLVLYLPKNETVGETQWGIPAVASDPRVGLERSDLPGPVAFVNRTLHPYSLSTVVDALGFPVLRDPDATFALDVSP